VSHQAYTAVVVIY